MNVINISLGGLLGAYATIKNMQNNKKIIDQGKFLTDIQLIFPYKNDILCITIKESEVKRVKQGSRHKQLQYALQFISLENTQKEKLIEILYEYQAQLLRERLPF